MKLSFLGQAYTPSFPNLEITGIQGTATFRGQVYTIKQFHVTHDQQPREELSFMGRRYTR